MKRLDDNIRAFVAVMSVVTMFTLYRLEQGDSSLESLNLRARALIALTAALGCAYFAGHSGWQRFFGKLGGGMSPSAALWLGRTLFGAFSAAALWALIVLLTDLMRSSPIIAYWPAVTTIGISGFAAGSFLALTRFERPLQAADPGLENVEEDRRYDFRDGDVIYDPVNKRFLEEAHLQNAGFLPKKREGTPLGQFRPLVLPRGSDLRPLPPVILGNNPDLTVNSWGFEAPVGKPMVVLYSPNEYRAVKDVDGAFTVFESESSGKVLKHEGERVLFLKRRSPQDVNGTYKVEAEERGWFNIAGTYVAVQIGAKESETQIVKTEDLVKYDASTWILLRKGVTLASDNPSLSRATGVGEDPQSADSGNQNTVTPSYVTWFGSVQVEVAWELKIPNDCSATGGVSDPVIANNLANSSGASGGLDFSEQIRKRVDELIEDLAGYEPVMTESQKNADNLRRMAIPAKAKTDPASYHTLLQAKREANKIVLDFHKSQENALKAKIQGDLTKTKIVEDSSVFMLVFRSIVVSFPLFAEFAADIQSEIEMLQRDAAEQAGKITSAGEELVSLLPPAAPRSLVDEVIRKALELLRERDRIRDELEDRFRMQAKDRALDAGNPETPVLLPGTSTTMGWEEEVLTWVIKDENGNVEPAQVLQQFKQQCETLTLKSFLDWLKKEGFTIH